MSRRAWTAREDEAIRKAAQASRRDGYRMTDQANGEVGPRARLAEVARRLGRSYQATRKRASRLGARSRP